MGTAFVLRGLEETSSFDSEQIEGDKRRRRFFGELGDARGSRMKPQLERIEIEPPRRGDHNLAVDNRSLRKPVDKSLVQLGEVAIQRTQIAALNINVCVGTEDNRSKAVPLGLEEEAAAGRQGVSQLGQHRLDRRPKGLVHTSMFSLLRSCSSSLVMSNAPEPGTWNMNSEANPNANRERRTEK
jgi:hypothetical protein